MKKTGKGEHQVWAAILFATGQADVFGAAARACTGAWTAPSSRPKVGPRRWGRADRLGAGRERHRGRPHQGHAVVVRSILPPLGPPPE